MMLKYDNAALTCFLSHSVNRTLKLFLFPKIGFQSGAQTKQESGIGKCSFVLKSLQPGLSICNQMQGLLKCWSKHTWISAGSMMRSRNVMFVATLIIMSDCCCLLVSWVFAHTSLSTLIYLHQFPCVDAPMFEHLQSLYQLGTNKQLNCPFLSRGAFCHMTTLSDFTLQDGALFQSSTQCSPTPGLWVMLLSPWQRPLGMEHFTLHSCHFYWIGNILLFSHKGSFPPGSSIIMTNHELIIVF